jgi:hypothetical protein
MSKVSDQRFKKVDGLLGSGLLAVADGDLGDEIVFRSETEAKQGRLIKGRQILWLVYEYFHARTSVGALYDYEDLLVVALKDESELRLFMHNWDSTVGGLRREPEILLLETLLLRQLRKCKCLEHILARYDYDKDIAAKAGLTSRDSEYSFLYKSAKAYLALKHNESQRSEELEALNDRCEQSTVSAPSPSPPQGARCPATPPRGASRRNRHLDGDNKYRRRYLVNVSDTSIERASTSCRFCVNGNCQNDASCKCPHEFPDSGGH